MNINITALVEVLISLVTTIISMFLIPYIKSKHKNEEIKKVLDIVDTVVGAAEQIGKTLGYNGEDKKEYVVSRLSEMGYTLDPILNDYIEAAVLKLHNELLRVDA